MKAIRFRLYEILFQTRDRDLVASVLSLSILTLIAANILVFVLETDPAIRADINLMFGYAADAASTGTSSFFYWFEFVSVMVFSVEYLLRLWTGTLDPEFKHPLWGRLRMVRRPMMLVDLIAVLPFYLTALLPGVDMRFIRALRLFRIFRIFRAGGLQKAFQLLTNVIWHKREELAISVIVVGIMVILSASVVYMVEHEVNAGLATVPKSMWWAVITITTIGYGDVAPITAWGQFFGAIVGFCGVVAFALPVGIIGAGFIDEIERRRLADQEEARGASPHEPGTPPTTPAGDGDAHDASCPHCGNPLHASHSAGTLVLKAAGKRVGA